MAGELISAPLAAAVGVSENTRAAPLLTRRPTPRLGKKGMRASE
jgi:hypothetical protein